MSGRKEIIRNAALETGFSHCGFARNESLEELRPRYLAWLEHNGDTGMNYLAGYLEKRLHPEAAFPGTRTVIAVLLSYYPPQPIVPEDNLILARYACTADYHQVVKSRLEELAGFLTASCGATLVRTFVDSGPVLEKEWARRCGIGWQGKNSLIINPQGGSFFFIGILLTDLDLPPDEPAADQCHRCDRCIRACPTGALDTPYRLDVARCIAYHTIESKQDIPPGIREKLNRRIYGCDLCQDACPYNRQPAPHRVPEFTDPGKLARLRISDWEALTAEEFGELFAETPVKRIGYDKFRMNINAAIPSDRSPAQNRPKEGSGR